MSHTERGISMTHCVLSHHNTGSYLISHWFSPLYLYTVLGDITIQPQDITVTQGQIAGFECQAENALPSHTVTWYKDSVQLNVSASTRYFVSSVTGTLFIREVEISDAGLYHCVCENGAGSETSEQALLTVALCKWIIYITVHFRIKYCKVYQFTMQCIVLNAVDTRIESESIPAYTDLFYPPT